MPKKILIATGGTGGHIYPAVAFVQKIFKERDDCEFLFIGGGIKENKYLAPYEFNKCSVSTATFSSKSPFKIFRGCASIAKGVLQSRSIIKEFGPDVAVGFGSYYSIPPMIAARIESIPLVLHEANSIPGLANKVLSPFADIVGVHFPETLKDFKRKSVVVGMPLRTGYEKGSLHKTAALNHYGLKEGKTTLLVFGGSQGAKIINQRFEAAMRHIKDKNLLQVIHITGDHSSVKELAITYKDFGIVAHVKDFENQMDIAWQAADLCVCRAGASTVAEIFEFEVPSILIPFQNAAKGHQEHNATFIVNDVKGCSMLREKDFSDLSLYREISNLLGDNEKNLKRMKDAISFYKAKSKRQDLSSLILERY